MNENLLKIMKTKAQALILITEGKEDKEIATELNEPIEQIAEWRNAEVIEEDYYNQEMRKLHKITNQFKDINMTDLNNAAKKALDIANVKLALNIGNLSIHEANSGLIESLGPFLSGWSTLNKTIKQSEGASILDLPDDEVNEVVAEYVDKK